MVGVPTSPNTHFTLHTSHGADFADHEQFLAILSVVVDRDVNNSFSYGLPDFRAQQNSTKCFEYRSQNTCLNEEKRVVTVRVVLFDCRLKLV